MDTPKRLDTADTVALTPAQVRVQYGISRQTLRTLEAQGYLSPLRLPSGHRRWRRSEIEQLLSSGGDAA